MVRAKKPQHDKKSSKVKVNQPEAEVKQQADTRESERIERMKLIPYAGAVGQ